jgi:hypothetical protein
MMGKEVVEVCVSVCGGCGKRLTWFSVWYSFGGMLV